jgi:PAS domain S-box-containing protein
MEDLPVMHEPHPGDEASRDASFHVVQLYEQDAELYDAVTPFLADGCESGGAAVVVATETHRHGIVARLRARGLDVAALEAKGLYVALDATATLSRFLVDGMPDAARFHAYVQPLVGHAVAKAARGRVRVFGEMVAVLWQEGRPEAALALERLWNDLRRRCPVSLLCAYPVSAFGADVEPSFFRQVCAEHAQVLPAGAYFRFGSPEERMGYVADLQRRAAALERESLRRREAEDLARRREAELADLLERTPECVVEIDAEGRVRWANRAQRLRLGYPDGDCVGRPVADLLARPDVFTETWARLLQGDGVQDVPVEMRARTGESVPMRIDRASLRLVDRGLRMRWFLRA